MDPVQHAIELKKMKTNWINGGHGGLGTLDEFLHSRPFEHKSGLKPHFKEKFESKEEMEFHL